MSKCWHEAPFNTDGHMQPYPGWRCEMRPVEPFHGTMQFCHFERGRSSTIAIFRRHDFVDFPVFVTDLADMIPLLKNGCVKADFEFTKRGENYGVRLVK